MPYRRQWTAAVLAAASLSFALPAEGATISFNYRAQTLFGHRTSGASNLDQVYDTLDGWGVTFLEPAKPINPLNYSTSAGQGTLYYNFFNTLNRLYPTTSGWTVTGNPTTLASGSLQINTYGAIGTPQAVGADLAVTYITKKPGTTQSNGNPTTNIHWIQVVSTNNAITYPVGVPTSNPGMLANKVDVTQANAAIPYYDVSFAANSSNFLDTSRRPDVEDWNNWIASLFLVSGPNIAGTAANPAQITVYNDSGILWGWQNFFFPDVNEQQFVNDVEQDVFGQDQLGLVTIDDLDVGLGPQTVTLDLLNPTTDYGLYEQAFAASLVPAPSSWILMLSSLVGLGLFAYRQKKSASSLAVA